MSSLLLEKNNLIIQTGSRETVLDLATVLRARFRDLSVERDMAVSAFEPRLVQPLAGKLVRDLSCLLAHRR